MDPRNEPPGGKRLLLLWFPVWLVTFGALLIVQIPVSMTNPEAGPGYPGNPSYAMVDTIRTLVETGSLQSENYSRLHRHFLEQSRQNPDRLYIQDLYAVGRDGVWLPKHPWFPVVVGAPFYLVGGEAGLLGLMALIFSAAVVSTALLTFQWAGPAWRSGCLVAVGLFFVSYPFWTLVLVNFSYDLLATVLVFVGFWLAPRRPGLAGALVALAFGCRVTHAFFIVLGLGVFLPGAGWKQAAGPFLCSAGLVVFGVLGINWWLYGHWAGGYATAPIYLGGEAVNAFSTHQFQWNILWEKGGSRLFWGETSMLRHYPGLGLALPLCLVGVFRRQAVGADLKAGLSALALAGFCLFFASFTYWEKSGGFRFVMVPALLYMAMAGSVVARWRDRR